MDILLGKLKPTPLSIILFLIIILFHVLFPVFWVSWSFAKWGLLAFQLAVSYVLAVFLSLAFVKATQFRRPALAFSLGAVVIMIIAFIASVCISKALWGYYFSRPPLLAEFNNITAITAVIPIETKLDKAGNKTVIVKEVFSLSESIAYCKEDPYYCLDERLLIGLKERHLLPATHSKTLLDLPALFPLIKDSGLLAAPDKGCEYSDFVGGIVVDAVDHSGARLVFLGLQGGQIWDDHYAYYEMLFSGKKGSSALNFVRGQRFFYDVAGIEGMEWYMIMAFLWFISIVPAFAIYIIVINIWRTISEGKNA